MWYKKEKKEVSVKLLKKLRSFRKITLALSLLVALTVVGVGGAALAGVFTVHTATLHGTVIEAFTVTGATTDGAWVATNATSGTWTLDGVPGNTETLHLTITSISSVSLNAIIAITAGCANVTGAGSFPVGAYGTIVKDIVWNVADDSPPGACTNTITVSR